MSAIDIKHVIEKHGIKKHVIKKRVIKKRVLKRACKLTSRSTPNPEEVNMIIKRTL